MKPIALFVLFLAASLSVPAHAAGRDGGTPTTGPAAIIPRTIIWAWERPEDLRFIDPHRTGVAYLAKTLTIGKGRMTVRPRLQPLILRPGTPLIAVVRIERGPALPASDLTRLQQDIVDEIVKEAGRKGVGGVQIDFDARRSEREFYRRILEETRRRIPRGTGLTMTALASWCLWDNWMDGLPVDEAVPMLFRMGPEKGYILSRIGSRADFPVGICRRALGVSLDEPASLKVPADRKLYIFSPRPWTREMLDSQKRNE